MELDRYDRAILKLLQDDAASRNTSLAEKVSLSESACLRRVKALEEAGVIESYTAVLNQQKAGYPVNVFVHITLDRQAQPGLEAFESGGAQDPGGDGVLPHDRGLRLPGAAGGGGPR